MKNNKVKIFCSYSHKDEEIKNELESHLAPLNRLELIDIWTDRRILPGDNWNLEIHENLEKADIILLLISSDFMSSNYCYDIEVKKAIEQHYKKTSITIPVILRECDWEDAPFAKIQGLPTDMKPVISKHWYTKDEAYKNISISLKKRIKELLNEKENTEQIEFEALPDTVEALRGFISKYNEGGFVQKAKSRLLGLDEENSWLETKKQNTIKSYEDYLAKYSSGKYKQQAEKEIENAKQIPPHQVTSSSLHTLPTGFHQPNDNLPPGNQSQAPQQCLRPAANVQHQHALSWNPKHHETASNPGVHRPVLYYHDHQRLETAAETR